MTQDGIKTSVKFLKGLFKTKNLVHDVGDYFFNG